MNKKQIFFCEKCQAVGVVFHDEHAGVMDVVSQIEKAHHKLSPDCDMPVTGIRCMAGRVSDLPEWARESALQLMAAAPGHDKI